MVGRAELLASLWYLSAILAYARSSHRGYCERRTKWKWLIWTVIFTTLAMLSKEQVKNNIYISIILFMLGCSLAGCFYLIWKRIRTVSLRTLD